MWSMWACFSKPELSTLSHDVLLEDSIQGMLFLGPAYCQDGTLSTCNRSWFWCFLPRVLKLIKSRASFHASRMLFSSLNLSLTCFFLACLFITRTLRAYAPSYLVNIIGVQHLYINHPTLRLCTVLCTWKHLDSNHLLVRKCAYYTKHWTKLTKHSNDERKHI